MKLFIYLLLDCFKLFISINSNIDFYCLLIFARSIDNIWVKVSKNGPSKICGRQPLKI